MYFNITLLSLSIKVKIFQSIYKKKVFKYNMGGGYNERLIRLTLDKVRDKESKKQSCM